MAPRPPTASRELLFGIGLLGAALAVQWTLRPLLGTGFPFLFFFPAIGIAATLWGWRAGAVVVLGGLFNSLLWFEPTWQLAVSRPAEQLAVAGYLVSAAILLVLGARVHDLRQRAAAAEANLGRQLQELRELNALSRTQQQQLQDADRRKDEFLATLAHELRNPLAPIRQAAVIARSDQATAAQRERAHQIIERQVRHMALLLDDLLDVSRITRGKLVLRREPTPLSVMLEAASEGARPLVAARRQRLELDLPPQELWLDADPMRVEQILSNLLGNAAKYGRTEGRIEVTARQDGGTARVQVRDDGIGIPADALESIFEMFEQLPRADQAVGSGLGIGLSLSRGLARLHGGSLHALSDGPGHGSTFVLVLPLATPPVSRPSPLDVPAERAVAGPRRVLVADDNRDAAESLAEVLRMDGHEVAVAFDGHEAVRLFRQVHPDVALLDIGMPGLTGLEVAATLRGLPEGRQARLVAVTGWGQARDVAATRAAGFDAHLTKPVDPAAVLDLLRRRD
jgi:signal transduction histidine kinase